MHQAKRMKVLFADEVDACLIHGGGRGRIVASIEDRQLYYGTSRPFHGQHLLASTRRTLEDAHMPRLNHKQAGTGLAFTEDDLSGRIISGYCPFGQELQLGG